jgi:hypothetical protein
MKSSRRVFLLGSLTAVSAFGLTREAFAAPPMVSESDPTAVSLGYKQDATKVDKTKFSNYAAGSECDNCQFFQGDPGAAAGGCAMFAGKQVAAKGWCTAYSKGG